MNNPYFGLTEEFNRGRLRAILCSDQSLVYWCLSTFSKDGDWILREDKEALAHVLKVLARKGSVYRRGAPLALEWLRHGWSSHFEHRLPVAEASTPFRARTDFFTRPPRVSQEGLERLWRNAENGGAPVADLATTIQMKRTRRKQDYIVIGEIATRIGDPMTILLHSRDPGQLRRTAQAYPDLAAAAAQERSIVRRLDLPDREVEMREADGRRIESYERTLQLWDAERKTVMDDMADRDLLTVHAALVASARKSLPMDPWTVQSEAETLSP
jgi:hypothetical protein